MLAHGQETTMEATENQSTSYGSTIGACATAESLLIMNSQPAVTMPRRTSLEGICRQWNFNGDEPSVCRTQQPSLNAAFAANNKVWVAKSLSNIHTLNYGRHRRCKMPPKAPERPSQREGVASCDQPHSRATLSNLLRRVPGDRQS